MKRGGIQALPTEDREGADNLLRQLAEYGIIIVGRGELESWLPELGITGHGPSWLVPMFARMGADPTDPNYVRPGEGDVWDFIGLMKEWAEDPDRRGVPRVGPA